MGKNTSPARPGAGEVNSVIVYMKFLTSHLSAAGLRGEVE